MNFDSDLIRGVADLIILKLVSERAMYGYEIIKLVNERTNGKFEWKEGTLYPVLHRLEASKLLSAEWQDAGNGRRRKYYRLALAGEKVLSGKKTEWKEFCTAVDAVLLAAQGI